MKELLGQVINDNKKLKRGIGEKKIEEVWAEEMGAMVSKYTDRIYYSGGTATIYLTSSTLRNQLNNAKESIIQRINEGCGENYVQKLNFR